MPQRYRTGAYGAMVADDNGPWVQWSDVVADAWQPIESAPKDGTMVLTFGRLGNVIVRYDAEREHQSEKQRILGYSCWRVDWDGEYLASEPTHWMPLPEPPQ